MSGGLMVRPPHRRSYVIDGLTYTAVRMPRSPRTWVVLSGERFLFLIHYRLPQKRYFLHGQETYSRSICAAIERGLEGY